MPREISAISFSAVRGTEGEATRLRSSRFVLSRRVFVIFFSVMVGFQFVPMLDRVWARAAQPRGAVGYSFDIQAQGILRSSCQEGMSRLNVAPGRVMKTSQGLFREVRLNGSFCTQFGFKRRDARLLLPAELFSPDSDVLQGVWETKTYTSVPSTRDTQRTLTLQMRRLPGSEVELSWIADPFEQPEYPSVRVKLGQPEEMGAVEDWRSELLPWKSIRFEYDHPMLKAAIVVQGKLTRIEPAESSRPVVFADVIHR